MSGIISFHGYKMKLINVYSPTEDKSEDVKKLFYKKIDEAVSQKSINSQLIILGDFNFPNIEWSDTTVSPIINNTTSDIKNQIIQNKQYLFI